MLRTENNNYRRAFWIALTTTIVLAIVASVLVVAVEPCRSCVAAWRTVPQASPWTRWHKLSANASDSESGSHRRDAGAATCRRRPLAPIQLTPQRMQSIGIVLGKVESKPVNSELRFYGNVQVDERRQAYVQTRFAGWIRKVYADATGNFIGKGQPLVHDLQS